MARKTVVITGEIPTFINGQLLPPGAVTHVDLDDLGVTSVDDASTPNLELAGKADAPVPYEVSTINPTGPNPTKPQALPPGAIAVGETYLAPGSEGQPAVQPVAEGAATTAMPTRRGKPAT